MSSLSCRPSVLSAPVDDPPVTNSSAHERLQKEIICSRESPRIFQLMTLPPRADMFAANFICSASKCSYSLLHCVHRFAEATFAADRFPAYCGFQAQLLLTARMTSTK